MSKYHFAFFVTSKNRTHGLANDLAAGAAKHGDLITKVAQDADLEHIVSQYDGAAVLGISRFAKCLREACANTGKHYMMFDKGYMGRQLFYKRVAIDGWQPLKYFQNFYRPDDRLHKIGLRINDRRPISKDGPIVIAGTCQNHNNFHGLGDVTEYYTEVVRNLREFTDREIVYRPNPSWFNRHNDEFHPIEGTRLSLPTTAFSDELEKAHLVVTHGSSAAFGAYAAGVPVMVLGEGIAAPVALHAGEWDKVEEPYWPHDRVRQQFFCDVAYTQWTHDEYISGQAWEDLRITLSGLEQTLYDLITQYKKMHGSPKYFKGLSIVKHFRDIGKLILETNALTLLDYGSGKGHQYLPPYDLNKAWEVNVTCYDPAVARFEMLPPDTSKFDGVVCCDVMEHIPSVDVPATLGEIVRRANKFAFFSIATTKAKKDLPDGRNCHVTIAPPSWWEEQIAEARQKYAPKLKVLVVFTGEQDE